MPIRHSEHDQGVVDDFVAVEALSLNAIQQNSNRARNETTAAQLEVKATIHFVYSVVRKKISQARTKPEVVQKVHALKPRFTVLLRTLSNVAILIYSKLIGFEVFAATFSG
jgi:hypothetical protein